MHCFQYHVYIFGTFLFLKVWWPYATLLYIFIFLLQYIHSYNHSLNNIRWGPSPFLHSCWLSGRNLPGVPSRDSNSGLPYSKPALYQLSCAAPYAAVHFCCSRYTRKILERCRLERFVLFHPGLWIIFIISVYNCAEIERCLTFHSWFSCDNKNLY